MRRRSRTATWIVAGVMLLSTMLTPRPSGAYRVPLEPPPQKGDPDNPGTGYRYTPPSSPAIWASVLIIRVPIAPGVYFQAVVRIPALQKEASSR